MRASDTIVVILRYLKSVRISLHIVLKTYKLNLGMGTINISDEERLRRSERMRQLHAEGRAGAEFGKLGGRPRKKRASEVAAEKIAEQGEHIAQVLLDLIDDPDSPKVRLDAIKHAHAIEEQERKTKENEEVKYEQLKHSELLELVVGNFFELIKSGRINFEDIIEAEVIEDQPAIGSGEID